MPGSPHLGAFPRNEPHVAPPQRSLALAVVGALCAARPALAQAARPLLEPSAFRLDQWTTDAGLPQNSVTAIAQAPDGHLWIGTFGGLARFDGTHFRLIERADSLGRHVDRILSLAVAPDSALWIGTEQDGLFRYHQGAFFRYTTADGLPDNTVAALHVDRRGTLWVGGPQGGVARFGGGRFEAFPDADGVPLAHVVSFHEDAAGTVWVNAGDRFVTIEDGTPSARRWRARLVPGMLTFALEDRAGARWFGLTRGLARVADGQARVYGRDRGIPSVVGMAEDPDGGYWLATNNDGLFFFQPEGGDGVARQYALPDGRRQYRIRAIQVDLEGNVWFGTDADGLLRVKRNVFTTYTSAHGLSYDVATAVYVDAAGVVWVGTNCWGVNAIDLARRTVRTYKPRMPGDPTGDPCVFALTESPPGTMWAGTYGGGLTRLTGGAEERLGRALLRDSVVVALFADRGGTVWAGTNAAGLAALDGPRVVATYTTEDGLAHDGVRVISQTRDGALWIGTLGGLSRLAEGRLTSYAAADGLSAAHVRALYEDADGNLWIGTYGGGLNRLRDGRFTAITRQDGLADDVVSAILEDDRGHLWMSGNRGIFRVDRDELVAFAEGRVRRVHSVLYGETDGLRNAETNGGFQPAAWKDAGGRLWFPTVQGVAVVDPARVGTVERPPPVTIDEVMVDGASQPPAERLVAGPGRPNLEFRYTGLSLTAPEHIVFRYRLDGFDQDWVEAGTRRVAYYPRLPPGRYRFRVSAATRDGVWDPGGTGLALQVTAPPWGTWWFRAGSGAGLLALAAVLLRRRELDARRRRAAQEEFSRRLIESQEHERRRIAGELHDGLGQELLVVRNRALLALQSDTLSAPAREQLQHISTIAAQSLESVRRLAHNLTPRQLDHLGLSEALRSMIEAVRETTEMTLEATVDPVDGLLPVEGEINLYRIVQEGLSNVVHHAGAGRAVVRIRREGDALRVTLEDDGRGFWVRRDDRGHLSGGFGLSGIAERVRILRGRIEVDSAPGRGTRVEVAVPIAGEART